jgi:methionine biosynthesis protein MetW
MNPFLYDEVASWIPDNARVLDLGTGEGMFLERLARERRAHVEGVERNPELVGRCIERHLIVHQGDVLDGLDQYSKGSFSHVLLLGTLQELVDPLTTLREAFRVGQRVIVAYSNFAYWRVRLQLLLDGRTPVTRALPAQWYRTSNMHFFSILDFESFCDDIGARQIRTACFNPRGKVGWRANLRADYALSLVEAIPGGDLESYRERSAH